MVSGPHRLNARFIDAQDRTVCQIVDNEMVIRLAPWDIEFVGPTLMIKNGRADLALKLTTLPGVGVRMDRLDFVHPGGRIQVEESGDLIVNGVRFTECVMSDGAAAIVV
jgi:hypothetical protein